MRVITSFFSVESQRLGLDRPVDAAPGVSTPAIAIDLMNGCREWLGMHEGQSRIAPLGKSSPHLRPSHRKIRLKVVFSANLME
jgi:hypothetical protein